MGGFFKHIAFELVINSFKVTLQWTRHFTKTILGWWYGLGTSTSTTKLPPNWIDQRMEMAYKVAYHAKAYNIFATLVINTN